MMTASDIAAKRFIDISIEKVIQLHEAGFTNQAIAQYADILSVYPENDDVIFNLAKLYTYTGRAEMALPLLQSIPEQTAHYLDALCMLGTILGDRGDFAGGVECMTRLLTLDAGRVECYNTLARYMVELGRLGDAYQYLTRSIQVSPDHADTYNYLGNLYMRLWRLADAGEQYKRVIELQPDSASAYNNLGRVAALEGKISEAVALFRTALELQPDFPLAANNLLFTLNYSELYSPEQVRDEHLRLAEMYKGVVTEHAIEPHRQGEKIRVGYVSGDFKTHSVAFFFEPVLCSHNRDNFEIFCYDMVPVPDETTHRMKNLGWSWRAIYGLSDSAVAEQVRADGIDILVDLSGHSGGNRLGVFAQCPAPVQVTWLGYPNTTGLKQITFRLTDRFADPSGMTDHLYAERLVRLPGSFLCYAPPASAPAIAPLPDGPIIFCCFNNYPKISDSTIKLWARVLQALPGSLLSLKNGSLIDADVRNRLVDRFAACGIERFRLVLASRSMEREEHLQRYGACHIALDTHPYNGTTTTCEALWMGVPVVTLAGASHVSRVGVSILNNVGLPELIAQNADQYIDSAIALARSPERLREYRHSLRARLRSSALMDASSFTADLEQAYRRMLDQPHV